MRAHVRGEQFGASDAAVAIVRRFGDLAAGCASTGGAISPAPMNSTFSAPKSSNRLPARRTMAAARLTVCMPISVPARTFFATANERWAAPLLEELETATGRAVDLCARLGSFVS